MATNRLIIKTDNADGIPSTWEIRDFEYKHGVSIGNVTRLYVTFKVKKRKKIKRLRVNLEVYPCEYCGSHAYMSGQIGTQKFDKGEVF